MAGIRGRTAASKVSTHKAWVKWDPEPGDVRAHVIGLSEQTLAASSAPEFGGNPERADPEELLVAALSSCHMLWFLALAREEGVPVRSYEDRPEGTLFDDAFTRVVLRPSVTFAERIDNERVASLHHRAHERCFIANSVSCPVEVAPAL